jgi:hypothetical protein
MSVANCHSETRLMWDSLSNSEIAAIIAEAGVDAVPSWTVNRRNRVQRALCLIDGQPRSAEQIAEMVRMELTR